MRPFLDHQGDAFRYAETKDRVYFFMEMRLGKTLVAIRWAIARGFRSILVIAPRGALYSWKEELALENEHGFLLRAGTAESRYTMAKFVCGIGKRRRSWALINPESVIPRRAKDDDRRYIPVQSPIVELPWDCVIVDESARIRNPKAMITKVVTRRTKARGRAVLCGLPNPEGLEDFFCQFLFVDGHFMHNRDYWNWKQRYFVQDPVDPFRHNPRYGTIKAVKEWVHDRAFVLTRKDAKIGSRKIYEKRTIELNAAQKKLTKQAKTEYECGDMSTEHIIVVLTWLARIAGGFHPDTHECINPAKAKELLSLIKGELKNEPLLVWFRFNAELFYVSKMLAKAKLDHSWIVGDVPDEDRVEARRDFQDGRFNILLMQVKCGKVGLDFSRSSTMIYYSNTFSNDDRSQSEDRFIHPQKTDPCLLLDLVTEGSVDEDVVKALRAKRQLSMLMLMKLWRERWKIST